MHRNTFINSTKLLNKTLNLKSNKNIYFAGQITGGEGYVCAIGTGLMASKNIINQLNGKKEFVLDDRTAIGAIIKYITEEKKNFQPMGPNFGIIRSLEERVRDKKLKYNTISEIGLNYLDEELKKEQRDEE